MSAGHGVLPGGMSRSDMADDPYSSSNRVATEHLIAGQQEALLADHLMS